ncbi:hypothetical protein BH11PSE11_BH11PSE11_01240 [soil metagenome]
MSRDWCSAMDDGVRVDVQVTSKAKKTEVIRQSGDTLKIRLHAQPLKGKAIAALIRFIAEALNLPISAVEITRGQTSKRKILKISASSLTPERVMAALLPSGFDTAGVA